MNDRAIFYSCVAGHPIDVSRLDEETEVVVLDAGAEVLICRLHGCPIAITVEPVPDRNPT